MKYSSISNNSFRNLLVVFGFIMLALTACAQSDNTKTNSLAGRPLNEQATADAWAAYDSGKYEEAIANADKCIEEFRGDALLKQKELEKIKPDLPTGDVSNDVKKKIFANGLLNDVATCYYIKGRSAERLKRNDVAIRAYEEAQKFTYARTWNSKDLLFWAPAEAAAGRIEGLK